MSFPTPCGDDVHHGDTPAPGIDPDAARLDRIRAGDERAFAELFRAYYAGLCSFVYARVRSGAIAEDLVMDVFRRLWEHRTKLEVHRSVRSYLFSAAVHAAASHLRHRRIEATLVRDVEAHAQSVPAIGTPRATPVMDAERAELAHAIARAADALPPRCRAVFLLWQQQLSYAEIADVLGVSIKTVENQLGRALRALRVRLAVYHR
jgi:RNA polymerase sigma-70 factor (ECF subfamily)